MKLHRPLLTAALAVMLYACAAGGPSTSVSSSSDEPRPAAAAPQVQLKLGSGTYHCELGQRVEVRRDPRDANQIEIDWAGTRHGLARLASSSGLPRYENRRSGLVWIDLPWKSVLLDADSGRPLANECKLS